MIFHSKAHAINTKKKRRREIRKKMLALQREDIELVKEIYNLENGS